jgi:hypothetical protein
MEKRIMKTLSVFLYTIVLVFGIVGTSNAFLYDRGGGLIYDSDQNLTWLQDANYAKTSGYDSDGKMNWYNATAWADQLVYSGYDDWRLPTTVDGPFVYGYDGTTTAGCNITSSEMGYMYYVNLGNLAYYATDGTPNQPGYGLSNTGPFINLDSLELVPYFFSGTEYSSYPNRAWYFNFELGLQDETTKDTSIQYAWAVRDGDVAPVPIPGAVWLLGSGMIALVGLRRKFRKEAIS